MPTAPPSTLGLIVNPVAGLGGAVGLRGTDGLRDEALRRGAVALAPVRAGRALARLGHPPGIGLLVAGGEMGETLAKSHGFNPIVVNRPNATTSARDTVEAAAEMRRLGADLVLFAGGDGTARDVLSALGRAVPMLGIPTGVKMHSACFATSPENAGVLARAMLTGTTPMRLGEAEIVDLDEALLRDGIVCTRLHGVACVPHEHRLVQQAKCRAGSPQAELDAACAELAATLEPGVVHLFGPGTTTQLVLRHLGLPGTLLGVDAVRDGALLGANLSEADILRLIEGQPARIVVGVVGGQGFLFGRGNQQISAVVIRRVGTERITVIAGADKIAALASGSLFVDTGDVALDQALCGYRRVRTSPSQSLLCKVLA